ncbi:m7GpppN-mRNA hydrolase [Phlebotomus argentipes]|uniref:m7GpppN-mRNA hydrolase n=1 Tax=Phlebotomus argentipes TaxID=94469 RepID=UPI002892ECF2|nr:m7GpppN-mRNA hydrolase [Phlebotomus argentipes]
MSAAKSIQQINEEFLDDLASRFIINVPEEERANLIRICFQVELAHWFYLDFYCGGEDDRGVSCTLKQFALQIFQHVPFLRVRLPQLDEILDNWKKYKLSVPTYGAILVSEDLNHVLLVQSYWAKSSWGFPKGKVNENESPAHCAVREVFEETGFDISHLIQPTDFFESTFNDQFTRLYVVANVPRTTKFIPRTRNEIKCCEWFPIELLPSSKTEDTKATVGFNANSFFMILPFIKRLKKWVHSRQEKNGKTQPSKCDSKKRQRHKSMGEIDSVWATAEGAPTPVVKRDKAPKANPKRQLFGIDATPEGSPSVVARSTPLKGKTKEGTKKPIREQFLVTPCREWDNFRFDIARICDPKVIF